MADLNQHGSRDANGAPNIYASEQVNKKNSKKGVFLFIGIMGIVILLLSWQMDFSEKTEDAPTVPENNVVSAANDEELSSWVMALESDAREKAQSQSLQADPSKNTFGYTEPRSPQGFQQIHESPKQHYSDDAYSKAAEEMRALKTRALMEKPEVSEFKRQDTGERLMDNQMDARSLQQGMINTSSGSALDLPQQQMTTSEQKKNFLMDANGAQKMTAHGYSENIPIPKQFRWELKAGTMIPTILMNGVDSSVPGMVRAQVAENVWDTTDGSHVLIPKGTMVIGVYNTDTRFGDKRIMFVWNRLVFPNGTTLNIAGTAGTDQSGYNGVSGRLNEHWDKMFLSALISSLFIAGAEVVAGGNDSRIVSRNEKKAPRDVMMESLASNIIEMNSKIMDRALNIAPTIRIAAGKRMGLFVNQDIVFPSPYPMEY